MANNSMVQRWPELQTVLASQDMMWERLVHETHFVEALLQAKPDVVPQGAELLTHAVQTAVARVNQGQSTADVVKAVEAELHLFSPLAKAYTVHCVGHAHIDMNWMWPWPETVEVCHDTFTTVNKLMQEFPSFHFSQSQAATYLAMEEASPALFQRIKERIAQGQWEVTANLWVEGDKNMAAGEALCRQVLYAKRYLRSRFNIPFATGTFAFEPDTFGHASTLPQILKHAGISRYYFCRAGKEHQLFWWEAPSGSRILAWNDSKLWYLGPIKPEHATEVIRHEQATGMQDYLLVYGVGDHGGGPTRRDLHLIQQMNEWPIWPTYVFSTFSAYFDLAEAVGPNLPIVRDELNFVFRGCYSSQSNIKLANRMAENLLVRAEALATLGHVQGWVEYPRADFSLAWRNACFNQFHDILPGSGVRATYDYAQGQFQTVRSITQMVVKRTTEQLAARLPVSQDGRPLLVFNSHPWTRSDGVTARVFDISRTTKQVELTTESGDPIPVQVVATGAYWGHDYVDIAWTAVGVPGLGYRTFYVKEKETEHDLLGPAVNSGWSGNRNPVAEWPDQPGTWAAADGKMQNEYFRLRIEPMSGALVSLIHRPSGVELVPAGARLGLFQVLYEAPHGMSAWEIGPITRSVDLLQGARLKVVEAGPTRSVLRAEHTMGESRISVDVILCQNIPRVDFRVKVNWLEVGTAQKDAPMLKMAFPLAISGASARFEIPFGSIERPANGAEVPTQQWMALSGVTQTGQPCSVAILNDCKYGCDVLGSTGRVTLLRSSYEPDPYPELKAHEINLALVFDARTHTPGELIRWGQEFNNPLQAKAVYAEGAPQTGVLATAVDVNVGVGTGVGAGVGVLGSVGGYLNIGPENVGYATLKVAEDSDDVVLRVFETDGVGAVAEIVPGWFVTEAVESDALEQPAGMSYMATDGKLYIPLQPYEIKTLLLKRR